MKKTWVLFLALTLILILAACGGDNLNESPQNNKASVAELTPGDIDAAIYHAVTSADTRMDSLAEAVTSLADGSLTLDEIDAYCEVAISSCRISLEDIAEFEEMESVAAYAETAKNSINNVYAGHIKLQDFLKSGDTADLEHTIGCIEMRNTINVLFVAARQQYLTDAGFTAEDVDAQNKTLGISSD